MQEHNNRKTDYARYDKMAAIQTLHSGAATFRRNTERASGVQEIRRQPLGRALLDQPRDRVSKATQAERPIRNHHRRRIGSTPPAVGRQFGPSPSIIPNANCMRCLMPPTSQQSATASPRPSLPGADTGAGVSYRLLRL